MTRSLGLARGRWGLGSSGYLVATGITAEDSAGH
jgi:hypothetical protein